MSCSLHYSSVLFCFFMSVVDLVCRFSLFTIDKLTITVRTHFEKRFLRISYQYIKELLFIWLFTVSSTEIITPMFMKTYVHLCDSWHINVQQRKRTKRRMPINKTCLIKYNGYYLLCFIVRIRTQTVTSFKWSCTIFSIRVSI